MDGWITPHRKVPPVSSREVRRVLFLSSCGFLQIIWFMEPDGEIELEETGREFPARLWRESENLGCECGKMCCSPPAEPGSFSHGMMGSRSGDLQLIGFLARPGRKNHSLSFAGSKRLVSQPEDEDQEVEPELELLQRLRHWT